MEYRSIFTNHRVNAIVWKGNILSRLPRKRSKRIQPPTGGKLIVTVFWDSQRLLLEHYQERDSAVSRTRYNEILCDKPKDEVCCQKAICCCPKKPFIKHLPTLLKPSGNQTLWYVNIPRPVLTLPLRTFTCLIHLNKP
jgi:hypothetical protein